MRILKSLFKVNILIQDYRSVILTCIDRRGPERWKARLGQYGIPLKAHYRSNDQGGSMIQINIHNIAFDG